MGLDKPTIKAWQEKNSTDQYPYEHSGKKKTSTKYT